MANGAISIKLVSTSGTQRGGGDWGQHMKSAVQMSFVILIIAMVFGCGEKKSGIEKKVD